MQAPTKEQELQWIKQYKAAAVALDEQYAAELQAMTPEESLRRSVAVLSIPVSSKQRWRESSGLVEQQAIFQRALEKHKS